MCAQLEGSTYDDLCVGCCGTKIIFYNGYYEAEYSGFSLLKTYGTWENSNDTIILTEADSLGVKIKYVKKDSLSYSEINNSNQVGNNRIYLIHKEVENQHQIFYYHWNKKKELHKTITLDSSNTVLRIRRYKNNKIYEQLFENNGWLVSESIWKNGKRKKETSSYSRNLRFGKKD